MKMYIIYTDNNRDRGRDEVLLRVLVIAAVVGKLWVLRGFKLISAWEMDGYCDFY